MTVLLPGDRIPIPRPSALDGAQQPIKLGPGTLRLGEFDPESVKSSAAPVVLATRAGVLGHVGSDAKGKGKGRSAMDVDEPSAAAGKSRKGEGWWVETNSKRVSVGLEFFSAHVAGAVGMHIRLGALHAAR